MADTSEDPVFDPNLKKKKKKKKKGTADAAAEEAAADAAPAEPAADEAPEEGASAEVAFDPSTKKKKKKKKKDGAKEDDGNESDDESFGVFDVSKMPKRKKRKKVDQDVAKKAAKDAEMAAKAAAAGSNDEEHEFAGGSDSEEEEEKAPTKEAPVWHGSDRAYEYDELLSRIFGMLNPDISSKKAFKMKPPVVVPDGTKRHILVNFSEICGLMHRLPEHLLSYMLAELGTSGSMDGQGRVTFKYAGRKAQKHMESVIKQYIKEYVLCKLCKSPDTKLNKDQATRLHFMVCGSCGASRSVNPIKSGFQAQVGKRKKR